jgi:hypothetical protein
MKAPLPLPYWVLLSPSSEVKFGFEPVEIKCLKKNLNPKEYFLSNKEKSIR